LRPDLEVAALAAALSAAKSGESLSTQLTKRAKLSPAAITILREATGNTPPREAGALAGLIKAVPLAVAGVSGLERAISTAGGVPFTALNPDFSLMGRPNVFVAGEMLDWEAPTGGYLLTACLATGMAAARGIEKKLLRG
jgi:predicted flavoprotein YhiN